jgi:glycosyltransferase involved in cell wall biosynthesis
LNIVVNFLPLKAGGGVQVGLDFIEQAKKLGTHHLWSLVATKGTALAEVDPSDNVKVVKVVPRNVLARFWFEYIDCRRLVSALSADVVFTLFGPHWPGARRIPHLTGCAHPYLAYPQGVDLWRHESFVARSKLRASIWHNARCLKSASSVVFETHTMARRTTANLGLDSRKVHVVKPACSSLVHPDQQHPETATRCATLPGGYKVLFLSGYYPHKNFSLLPRAAQCLKEQHGIEDLSFIITLPHDLPATEALLRDAASRNVDHMLYNFGPVPQAGCAELYKRVDAVILPSSLESFSNTIAEAWTMRKPLLVSDLDWARDACGNGAAYITYDDAEDTAASIAALRGDPVRAAELIDAGTRARLGYPSSEQRFKGYQDLIQALVPAR